MSTIILNGLNFHETWERLVDDGLLTDPTAWIGASRTLESWNVERAVAALNVPTLLIWGAGDTIISRASAELAARAIPGCRLMVLEGVGHSPNIERPDEFARLLAEFIGTQA